MKSQKSTFTAAYSLSLDQIAKISDLATRWDIKQSKVVRYAIDEFYKSHQDQQAAPEFEDEQLQPA